MRDEGQGSRRRDRTKRSRSASKAGMPVEIFHLKVAYQPGWGILMDSVRQTVEAARARGVDVAADHVRLHGGRHGARGDDSELGAGGRRPTRSRRASRIRQIRARLKREIDDRVARLVEHHRGGRRLGRHRARRTRAIRPTRSTSSKTIAQIAQGDGARIPPTRRGISSRRAAVA